MNVVPLTGSNSVMVFYNGDDTSTDDTTGGSGSGTGTGGSGTGGGTGSGTEDPGTGGSGTEDPGTGGSGTEDPGTGDSGEDDEPEETIVPIEEDPYEGKFGEYVGIATFMLPGATTTFELTEFGDLGVDLYNEGEAAWAKGEDAYEEWWYSTMEAGNRWQLFAMVVEGDEGNPDATHYDAMIALDGNPDQTTTAIDKFPNVVFPDTYWQFRHNAGYPIEQSDLVLTNSIIGNMHLVLVKRAKDYTG